jgi:UDP-perosamine 4-acetyltransferase
LGAGGHAKVVIETLEEHGGYEIAGCTGEPGDLGDVLGYPILGSDDVLPQLYARGVRHAVPAIGDNARRRRVALRARQVGFTLASAVSPRAGVSGRARLGQGILIVRGAVVNASVTVGDGTIINTGATVDHDCEIGPWVHVAPGVHLAGRVSVGEGALLGVGSSVLPGIRVGAWARVGAGAAVTRDVPDGATVVGVPARLLAPREPSSE